MHLLKLSITKDTRCSRDTMLAGLQDFHICSEDKAKQVLPSVRSKTDSVRSALSYVLLSYQRFDHNGRLCKILAKSPKNAKKRGLDIQLNVQAIGDDTVEYSEQILKLYAPNANSTPELILQPASNDFYRLVDALDIDTLISKGQGNLYANDVRKIIESVLEQYTVSLWTGLSLVLDETGLTYIKRIQALCDKELSAGTVTLSTLALDMSQANRSALARELAEEFNVLLGELTERCGYTAPNVKAIEKEYDALTAKIEQVQSLLGVTLPCKHAQLDLESALMALD